MDPTNQPPNNIGVQKASGARHFKYWNNIIPCVVVVVKKEKNASKALVEKFQSAKKRRIL
jgi:hypothetical protein